MCVYVYIMYKGVLYTLKNQGKEDKLISLQKSRKAGDECIKYIKSDSKDPCQIFLSHVKEGGNGYMKIKKSGSKSLAKPGF